MPSPNQMITNELNPVKGWPSPYAVDKTLAVNIGATSTATQLTLADAKTYFVSGRVATQLSTNGKLVLGVQDHAAGICPMPLFIFPNARDFDVLGDDGNMVGMNTQGVNFAYTGGGNSPFTPAPLVTGLVAVGSYELETTEWQAADVANLVPGRLLTASAQDATNATTLGNSGRLLSFTATPGVAKVVCGVVSDGLINSEFVNAPTNAQKRLRFWPTFVPRFA
jgi:hypothetical protein